MKLIGNIFLQVLLILSLAIGTDIIKPTKKSERTAICGNVLHEAPAKDSADEENSTVFAKLVNYFSDGQFGTTNPPKPKAPLWKIFYPMSDINKPNVTLVAVLKKIPIPSGPELSPFFIPS